VTWQQKARDSLNRGRDVTAIFSGARRRLAALAARLRLAPARLQTISRQAGQSRGLV